MFTKLGYTQLWMRTIIGRIQQIFKPLLNVWHYRICRFSHAATDDYYVRVGDVRQID